MSKTDLSTGLREAILALEKKQVEEGKILKEQFLLAYESIKPINLIKNTFKQVAESKDLKESIINTSVGLATGYVSKKLYVGSSHNPLRKLIGTVLMFGMSNIVSKNTGVIKSFGEVFLKKILDKPDANTNGVLHSTPK